jgi:hypothetical protein
MNWAAIRPALLSAVVQTTGLKPSCVFWKGSKEEAGWTSGGVAAKCSIASPGAFGRDEIRSSYDAVTQTRTVTISGARRFTFTVRFETQDGSDSGIAVTYADRLRARIRRRSIADALRAAEVSVATIQDTQTIDGVKSQSRVLSVAVVDLIMNGVENDVDTTEGAGDWVKQASMTGTLTNADGTKTTVPELTKRVQ